MEWLGHRQFWTCGDDSTMSVSCHTSPEWRSLTTNCLHRAPGTPASPCHKSMILLENTSFDTCNVLTALETCASFSSQSVNEAISGNNTPELYMSICNQVLRHDKEKCVSIHKKNFFFCVKDRASCHRLHALRVSEKNIANICQESCTCQALCVCQSTTRQSAVVVAAAAAAAVAFVLLSCSRWTERCWPCPIRTNCPPPAGAPWSPSLETQTPWCKFQSNCSLSSLSIWHMNLTKFSPWSFFIWISLKEFGNNAYLGGIVEAGQVLGGDSNCDAGDGDGGRQQQHKPVEALQETCVAANHHVRPHAGHKRTKSSRALLIWVTSLVHVREPSGLWGLWGLNQKQLYLCVLFLPCAQQAGLKTLSFSWNWLFGDDVQN